MMAYEVTEAIKGLIVQNLINYDEELALYSQHRGSCAKF